MARLAFVVVVVALALVALAPAPAVAAPAPIGAMRFAIEWRSDSPFFATLQAGCAAEVTTPPFSDISSVKNDPPYNQAIVSPTMPSTGSYDGATGRGTAATRAPAFNLSNINAGKRGAAIADLGLQISGRSAWLIGSVKIGRTLFSRTPPRRRIAKLAGFKLSSGPGRDDKGRPVPNTIVTVAQGTAKTTAVVSAAFERVRCPRTARVRHSRRLPAGTVLGKVVVGMFPNRAAGLTGTVDLAPEFEIDPDVVATSQAVKVAPVAPAARVTVNGESVLRLPASAGPGVPLTCVDGADCVPSGPMALLGGMTISAGPATSTASALSVAFASGRAPATLDGTLDGTPLRLGAGVGLDITDDANAHLRSLFGAPLVGHFARPAASFTQTRLP